MYPPEPAVEIFVCHPFQHKRSLAAYLELTVPRWEYIAEYVGDVDACGEDALMLAEIEVTFFKYFGPEFIIGGTRWRDGAGTLGTAS